FEHEHIPIKSLLMYRCFCEPILKNRSNHRFLPDAWLAGTFVGHGSISSRSMQQAEANALRLSKAPVSDGFLHVPPELTRKKLFVKIYVGTICSLAQRGLHSPNSPFFSDISVNSRCL